MKSIAERDILREIAKGEYNPKDEISYASAIIEIYGGMDPSPKIIPELDRSPKSRMEFNYARRIMTTVNAAKGLPVEELYDLVTAEAEKWHIGQLCANANSLLAEARISGARMKTNGAKSLEEKEIKGYWDWYSDSPNLFACFLARSPELRRNLERGLAQDRKLVGAEDASKFNDLVKVLNGVQQGDLIAKLREDVRLAHEFVGDGRLPDYIIEIERFLPRE